MMSFPASILSTPIYLILTLAIVYIFAWVIHQVKIFMKKEKVAWKNCDTVDDYFIYMKDKWESEFELRDQALGISKKKEEMKFMRSVY